MLEIINLQDMTRLRITQVNTDVIKFAKYCGLNGQQKTALFEVIKSDKLFAVQMHELLRLVEVIGHPKVRHLPVEDFEIDERGNAHKLTMFETYLSLNPFFTEEYALDELDKVMNFALSTGVLESRYGNLQLTFHDVKKNARGTWMNAREFIGEVLYPRLSKTYKKYDRALNKLRTNNTDIRGSYLYYRRRFIEPEDPRGPSHRGRITVKPLQSRTADYYGIMSPKSESLVKPRSITLAEDMERQLPGKLHFLPPLACEHDLLNDAEIRRRSQGFPFVAGPSGSMCYDLAVYDHFLVHGARLGRGGVEYKEKFLAFAVSRAIAYVKYGHHSFYEALAPVEELIRVNGFSGIQSLYTFIVPYIEMGMRSGSTYNQILPHRGVVPLKVHYDSYFFDWLDWRGYKPKAYQCWTIRRKRHGPVGLNDGQIAAGKYIYVILVSDRSVRYLPTHPDTNEQYRSHSQLAGGMSVFAAGYFTLGNNNIMTEIDNSSGHYKPGVESVAYGLQVMGKLGFCTDTTTIVAHALSAADTKLAPWLKQQIKTTVRIIWVDSKAIIGTITCRKGGQRTRSFPTPPLEFRQYMPY
jgi:hypothetical protein